MKSRDAEVPDLRRYLEELVTELKVHTGVNTRIVLKCPDGSYAFIRPSEIRWVDALRNYVRVNVGDSHYMVRQPIHEFERRLDGRFVRIHRSTIVNSELIRAVTRRKHGDYLVEMDSGERLNVSRSYKAGLEAILDSAGSLALSPAV